MAELHPPGLTLTGVWQVLHPHEQFCATPSPWQGSAVVNPELTAKLLAMGKESSDGRVQDPVAMIVASAAAAANREPPPPPQAPAPVYCKTAASPLAPPLRLPRIESGIGIIDEGETSGLHSLELGTGQVVEAGVRSSFTASNTQIPPKMDETGLSVVSNP
ncbi:unnamed protein product [Effrenium voratum]|nr:unnamed protein product [Effrenium voratum]